MLKLSNKPVCSIFSVFMMLGWMKWIGEIGFCIIIGTNYFTYFFSRRLSTFSCLIGLKKTASKVWNLEFWIFSFANFFTFLNSRIFVVSFRWHWNWNLDVLKNMWYDPDLKQTYKRNVCHIIRFNAFLVTGMVRVGPNLKLV